MMGTNRIGVAFRCLVVAACMTSLAAWAQDEREELDVNSFFVKGELYIWNRISDVFDVLTAVSVAGRASARKWR